tara:strand:+ start:12712 stop:16194 length:3483 start_codon:yes stop_codon:yes gene_type:complete
MSSLWNIRSGIEITTLIERSSVDIPLPVANGLTEVDVEIIAGSLPTGLRIEGTSIRGTAYEVSIETVFSATLRATWQGYIDDRNIRIVVVGADDPAWVTTAGLLPVGSNNTFFILDNEIIDFQLLALDTDLPAGDTLEYYIAEGDGTLPPGITLTEFGKITGTTEPLLALDKRYIDGGYDSSPYGEFVLDYGVAAGNGFSSFFYDTQTYDFSETTTSRRKLNRYYPFSVTVTDGETFIKRDFKIYVVGDDFLRADNTTMYASSGVFTADTTHLRTPQWVTPRNLGIRRANNYQTIYLDIIDNSTLTGTVVYTLDDLNDTGTVSKLPPGLSLDNNTGEITGIIPYQPAITQDYSFTVRASRYEGDIETITIFGTFYEDTLLGATSFKVAKLDTSTADGIDDLAELRNRIILINGNSYTVTNIDNRNALYDVIFVNNSIGPNVSLILSRGIAAGSDYLMVNRLTETNKIKYQGRTLKFSESESYVIQDVIPYIEYEIEQTDAEFDPILPAGAPRKISLNDNFYVGEYAIYSSDVGGDNAIYQCIVSHSITGQSDNITFINGNWTAVAANLSELSETNRLVATKQALEAEYGGVAYINVVDQNRWRIIIKSTASSRILTNIREFFAATSDSSQITVKLIRDNEDRIGLDTNLTNQLNGGRNIGIALFRKDSFSKNIAVVSNDEVVLPSKAKTFDIKVIGEIDSNIKWITPANLGTINANFTSTLYVQAETTVPDTAMIYTIIRGNLPNGMHLNYKGEIIGEANQYSTNNMLGLTTFDNATFPVAWDGSLPGDTTFDRSYKFTVDARDRFGYTAIEREFILSVTDRDNTIYTDIYVKPMLKKDQRNLYTTLVSQSDIFLPENIYRADDINFGLQRQIKMLMYAGIEAASIDKFVSAAAKHHKRTRYTLGEVKKAVAREPGTSDVVYEVVYVDVIDNRKPAAGKVAKSINITHGSKLSINSMQYTKKDDIVNFNNGDSGLAVYGRQTVKLIFSELDEIRIDTRSANDVRVNVDNNDFVVTLRDNGSATVILELTDSEPYKIRPNTNTIKADSDAIKVSQSKDVIRYISSIENMRDNIQLIGENERNYLPLWMRTSQNGFQELGYVSAIPICYCIPGKADEIISNIKNYGFDFRNINFDVDRYIVERSEGNNNEQYILFANYQFNI